ncbi:DUF6505 family protein [uncultured Thiohalocapsa sp.]|uniref:DUF6505 family protein n=1 Tax=uncultured Thiohalocapsa sp. TaxID=768990 RepID=UPI0025DCB8CC|nr:DUF6505 family protein [uncultured Thiohalocapsa sp.]
MPKFLRTLPPSDEDRQLYTPVSPGDEWAVPGSFAYAGVDPASLPDSLQASFAHCFLGIDSFAHASVVEVAEIDQAELDGLRLQLALAMVQRLGAPGLGAALPVAEDEIAYALSLAVLPVGTQLLLEREWRDGDIQENVHRLQPAPNPLDHSQLRMFGSDPEHEP